MITAGKNTNPAVIITLRKAGAGAKMKNKEGF
jgi:hypothetical protein